MRRDSYLASHLREEHDADPAAEQDEDSQADKQSRTQLGRAWPDRQQNGYRQIHGDGYKDCRPSEEGFVPFIRSDPPCCPEIKGI
ncbi:hypothetical protein D9M69_717520 [compost metagenome]